jgi:hypothetical protein
MTHGLWDSRFMTHDDQQPADPFHDEAITRCRCLLVCTPDTQFLSCISCPCCFAAGGPGSACYWSSKLRDVVWPTACWQGNSPELQLAGSTWVSVAHAWIGFYVCLRPSIIMHMLRVQASLPLP